MAVVNMHNHRLWARLLLLLGMVLTLPLVNACAPVEMAVEDRSGGDISRDTQMKAGLIADISREMSDEMATRLGIDVYEQTVMVTGKVKSDAERRQVGAIVRGYPYVKKFYDEIQVIPEGSEAEVGFIDDVVIKQKLYAKMAATDGVYHTNWRYRSVNGVVYLFGRALSQEEMDKVITLAKDTKDVRKVVNHAFVRAPETKSADKDSEGGSY